MRGGSLAVSGEGQTSGEWGGAFRRLSLKWQFSLAILLHLLDLVLDKDSLVDHPLEILVVGVEKLELNLIIESIQECIMFLLISINIIPCIP
jgi:hypothetical protein